MGSSSGLCCKPGFGGVEGAHLADDRIRPAAGPPANDRLGTKEPRASKASMTAAGVVLGERHAS